MEIVWTDYMKFRAALRRIDLAAIEDIVRYSLERYHDNETGRLVAVGRYRGLLTLVPYDVIEETIVPITVHPITRPQINARIVAGRFSHE